MEYINHGSVYAYSGVLSRQLACAHKSEMDYGTLHTISYWVLLTEMAAFELTMRTAVRGYHVYKEIKLGIRNRRRIHLKSVMLFT